MSSISSCSTSRCGEEEEESDGEEVRTEEEVMRLAARWRSVGGEDTDKVGPKKWNHIWFSVDSNWSMNRDSGRYNCLKSGCYCGATVLLTPTNLHQTIYILSLTPLTHRRPFHFTCSEHKNTVLYQ